MAGDLFTNWMQRILSVTAAAADRSATLIREHRDSEPPGQERRRVQVQRPPVGRSRLLKRYGVVYDDRLQGRYRSEAEARKVAEAAASMQRFTFVTDGFVRNSLIAVFPRGHETHGREVWRAGNGTWAGGAGPAGVS